MGNLSKISTNEQSQISNKTDLDGEIILTKRKTATINTINEGKFQHLQNVAEYVFSTNRSNYDDRTMTEERAKKRNFIKNKF